MPRYAVYYRGSQSHVERVERVEANSVLEAQIKLRDSLREEEVQALIFDAVLVQEEAQEQNKLEKVIKELEVVLMTKEEKVKDLIRQGSTANISLHKGIVTGLRQALEIIKQNEE